VKRLALVLAVSFAVAGAAQAADPKATFAAKCAMCHGPDGKGNTAPGKKFGVKDLTATKLAAADLETVIAKGRGSNMKAFEGKLSPEEIKAMAAFIKGGLK
jgi:mono/diheme cytochrome c family protein